MYKNKELCNIKELYNKKKYKKKYNKKKYNKKKYNKKKYNKKKYNKEKVQQRKVKKKIRKKRKTPSIKPKRILLKDIDENIKGLAFSLCGIVLSKRIFKKKGNHLFCIEDESGGIIDIISSGDDTQFNSAVQLGSILEIKNFFVTQVKENARKYYTNKNGLLVHKTKNTKFRLLTGSNVLSDFHHSLSNETFYDVKRVLFLKVQVLEVLEKQEKYTSSGKTINCRSLVVGDLSSGLKCSIIVWSDCFDNVNFEKLLIEKNRKQYLMKHCTVNSNLSLTWTKNTVLEELPEFKELQFFSINHKHVSLQEAIKKGGYSFVLVDVSIVPNSFLNGIIPLIKYRCLDCGSALNEAGEKTYYCFKCKNYKSNFRKSLSFWIKVKDSSKELNVHFFEDIILKLRKKQIVDEFQQTDQIPLLMFFVGMKNLLLKINVTKGGISVVDIIQNEIILNQETPKESSGYDSGYESGYDSDDDWK